MSLKKQVLKTKNVCKVTFAVNAEEAKEANSVHVVGEFNDWSETANPLKKYKNGSFKAIVNMEKGTKYQFKYLIDGEKWMNDTEADSYVSNDFSGENSVVITE